MQKIYLLILSIVLLQFSLRAQEKNNIILKRAGECAEAVVSGNYGRYVELTYPKVVELAGGKEMMIINLEKGRSDMIAEGYNLLSATVDTAKDVIIIDAQRFVVVPYVLKIKAPNGYLLLDTFMLGVASVNDENWTFVFGAGLDESQFKLFFPSAVGKIDLPPRKPPVFQKSSHN